MPIIEETTNEVRDSQPLFQVAPEPDTFADWKPRLTGGKWFPHIVTINDTPFDVIRRPRIFDHEAYLEHIDPDGERLSQYRYTLLDGIAPEWVFEFDIDYRAAKATLRIVTPWPGGLLPLDNALTDNMKSHYREGLLTYLDNDLFPLTVRFDATAKTGSILQMGLHGDGVTTSFPVFMELKLFEDTPFGMLDCDKPRQEVASTQNTSSKNVGSKKPRHKISVNIAMADFGVSRRTIHNWLNFRKGTPDGFTLEDPQRYAICLREYLTKEKFQKQILRHVASGR